MFAPKIKEPVRYVFYVNGQALSDFKIDIFKKVKMEKKCICCFDDCVETTNLKDISFMGGNCVGAVMCPPHYEIENKEYQEWKKQENEKRIKARNARMDYWNSLTEQEQSGIRKLF